MSLRDAICSLQEICEELGHEAALRIVADLWIRHDPIAARSALGLHEAAKTCEREGAASGGTGAPDGWKRKSALKWNRGPWQVELIPVMGRWLIRNIATGKFQIDEEFESAEDAMASCDKKRITQKR